MDINEDIQIPQGAETVTIQKVTGDNAGENSRATFTRARFEKMILDDKGNWRTKYKDWKRIDDIPKKPKSMSDVIDIALEKGIITKRGIHYFLDKENLGKKKTELSITAEQLFTIQSKING